MTQPTLFDGIQTPEATRFEQYHKDNPEIYENFKKYALQAIRKGHKRLSAEFIFNVIRWETRVSAQDGDFKINNDMKPWYSRLFQKEFPEHRGFFETRRSKADAAAKIFCTGM